MPEYSTRTAAQQLAELREAGRRWPAAQHWTPSDEVLAIETQQLLVEAEGFSPRAWKVVDSRSAQRIVFAPMHPLLPEGDARFAWRAGSMLEAEVAVEFGRDLPARAEPYGRDEILAAVSRLYLGAEILFGAVEELWRAPWPLCIADRLANSGYALGVELPLALLDRIDATPLTVKVGDDMLYDGLAKHPKGDPLAVVVAFANAAGHPDLAFRAGSIVTTGALCGVLPIDHAGRVRIQLGSASLAFDLY